jgi:hypothetical protein
MATVSTQAIWDRLQTDLGDELNELESQYGRVSEVPPQSGTAGR